MGFISSFVFILLGVHLVLLGLLLISVLYRRTKRLLSRRNNDQREEQIRKYLMDHYFATDDDHKEGEGEEKRLQVLKKENRGFVRRVLLGTVTRFRGEDRQVLVQLYQKLGFLRGDVKQLSSLFWWKRLDAVIRLERLRSQEALPHLLHLMEDPHELVALAAMRSVSQLELPNKVALILDSLSRRAPYRKDIFIDILNNLGVQALDEITAYLDSCYDPYIASLCLSVLGNLKQERSFDKFRQYLTSSNDEVVAESVRGLGALRKLSALPLLEEVLEHPSAEVRRQAVLALVRIEDPSSFEKIEKLQEDSSVEVRRVVFYALQSGRLA